MQRADAQLRIDFVVFAESSWSNEKGKLPAFFPRFYGPDSELRVAAYRQMASARTEKELNAISRDWRDRFGRFPKPIVHLIETNRLRIIASAKGVQIVEIHNDRLKLQRNGDYILPPGGKFPRLSSKKPADKLLEAVQLLKSL